MREDSFEPFYELLPDVICVQETKTGEEPVVIDGYHHYYLPVVKSRYCGALIMSLEEPIAIKYGMGVNDYDTEPRVLTAEYPEYYIINTYAPNVVDKLERRIFRVGWSRVYQNFVESLMKHKPVILCGDFNVSLSELDYYNENYHKKQEEVGFESDERTAMRDLVNLGFTDAYRYFYPNVSDSFTQWPSKGDGRAKNRGARLDYFFVSDKILPTVEDVVHHTEMRGSDHCPIELILKDGDCL
jgi:exodeoxyribonuclease-3